MTKNISNTCKKSKVKSKSQLIRELDLIFSKYIRLRNSDNGINTCITCGVSLPINKLQCGHYYSRKIYSLRWNEYNCHPQCIKCNLYHEGEKPVYTIALIQMYGINILYKLNKISKTKVKYTIKDIKKLINYYKNKIEVKNGS